MPSVHNNSHSLPRCFLRYHPSVLRLSHPSTQLQPESAVPMQEPGNRSAPACPGRTSPCNSMRQIHASPIRLQFYPASLLPEVQQTLHALHNTHPSAPLPAAMSYRYDCEIPVRPETPRSSVEYPAASQSEYRDLCLSIPQAHRLSDCSILMGFRFGKLPQIPPDEFQGELSESHGRYQARGFLLRRLLTCGGICTLSFLLLLSVFLNNPIPTTQT